MYDIGNAMYDKAERYYNAAMVFNEREIFDAPFIIESEIATECFLSSIIEKIYNKPMQNIFGHGCVPHDLARLYDKLYPSKGKAGNSNPLLPAYDGSFRTRLTAAYLDYGALRYPNDSNSQRGMRIVGEKSIRDDIKLLEDTKNIADYFRQKSYEQISDIQAEENVER